MPQLQGRAPAFRLCSIAANNYLGSVCVLAESFRRHHPEIPITVLVVDGDAADPLGGLPFEVMFPSALPLAPEHFGQMATYYDVTELSTALKPFLFQALLAADSDVVMYLDPDIEVFQPLDELAAMAVDHEIVLTPHVTKPVPRDGLATAEESFLVSGQFNLGFIAVSAAAAPFLEYWSERTRQFAVRDTVAGYFTDQRWVDAVPTLFQHVVLRDPTCNVAYWNLHERTLAVDADDVWTIDDEPLKFFHFSGHDAAEPYRLTKHIVGHGRVRVDLQPQLRRLLKERSERILASDAGYASARYGFDRTPLGTSLRGIRRFYWDAVRSSESRGLSPPPHGFGEDGGAAFRDWCRGAASTGSPVPRGLLATWAARTDLQRTFPDPLGKDGASLVAWALDYDLEASAALGVLDTLVEVGISDALPGVNLVGYLDGEFGVGAAGRLVARMVRAAGLPLATTTVCPEQHHNRDAFPSTLAGTPFDLSVIAMNADALLAYSGTRAWEAQRGKRRVGVWYWEVGEFPEHLRPALDLVDEVWCSTDHVRSALIEWADRPVLKHPLVIEARSATALTRQDLGLPEDKFLFGFAFDYASVVKRKNPVGLIRAYRDAFGPDEGATLVMKSIHAGWNPETSAIVREAAGSRPDILFLDGHLEPVEMRALFELLDCYVSMHRSEGLGLTIAEAMAAGTPAIATGWSGNMEFMTPENSVLLPFDLVEVGSGADPYPAGAIWAEPRAVAATAAMRRMFDEPDLAVTLGQNARVDLGARFDLATAVSWVEGRFNALTGSKVLA